jgi:predicted pyridoxine 5'-phosphate oxidase superfamily flavin-nucleotide-binding protein
MGFMMMCRNGANQFVTLAFSNNNLETPKTGFCVKVNFYLQLQQQQNLLGSNKSAFFDLLLLRV